MKCCECMEFLIDYLEGRLPESTRTVFEVHLSRCPPCRTYIETYRLSIQLGQTACRCSGEEAAEMPEQLVQAILAALRQPGTGPQAQP
jgi:anti-sigma factor RsiW